MILSCSFLIDPSISTCNSIIEFNSLENLQSYLSLRSDEQLCRSPNLGSTFATEDLPMSLASTNFIMKSFIYFFRKLVYLLPINLDFRIYILRNFNRSVVWVVSGFSTNILTRMAKHNSNVFLKLKPNDSPESFFLDMQILLGNSKSLCPEINLYLDIE